MSRYIPLGVVVLFSLVFSWMHVQENSFHPIMNGAMGYFLMLLSMLKLFDLHGFQTAFRRYDLVTQKLPGYGYVYPFLELGLGMFLILGKFPWYTNLAILTLMSLTLVGVIRYLVQKKSAGFTISCACMGTSLNLPLSSVTLLENVGMGLMALYNLIIS